MPQKFRLFLFFLPVSPLPIPGWPDRSYYFRKRTQTTKQKIDTAIMSESHRAIIGIVTLIQSYVIYKYLQTYLSLETMPSMNRQKKERMKERKNYQFNDESR